MEKIINLIIQAIMWIVGIIVIVMIILKILGRSPGYEEIIVGLLVLVFSKIYTHGSQLGALGEFKRNTINSFQRIKEDITELKQGIQETNEIVKRIEKKLQKQK